MDIEKTNSTVAVSRVDWTGDADATIDAGIDTLITARSSTEAGNEEQRPDEGAQERAWRVIAPVAVARRNGTEAARKRLELPLEPVTENKSTSSPQSLRTKRKGLVKGC